MTSFPLADADLRADHFARIAAMVKHAAGIDLRPGKEGLVRSRLARRVRDLGLPSYDEYLAQVERDASGAELVQMLDLITTNKTSFFREPEHFRFLQDEVLPALGPGRSLRVWSAGCSSGEEPYTTAIVLREALAPERFAAARILATDLSTRVLARARRAVYPEELLRDVPAPLARRHFVSAPADAGERMVGVADATRAPVRFARLNLMAGWPMRGPFDVIFCRNVMIYFDKATQERLVSRFAELLAPGGYLFVGHSESLTGTRHPLTYVQPAVYRR